MTEEIDAVPADEPDVLSAEQAESESAETQETEAEAERAEAEEQPAPKPKKSAQERISEITAARREAERERDYWRNAAMNGQPAPQQRQQQEQPRDAAPNPDSFQYGDADPNYLVALAKHEAVQQVRQEFEAREQSQRLTASRSTFEQKVAETFPDGEPEGIAALRSLPAIRSEITDVIFNSDKGPLLAEHLGDNPSVLTRLQGLAPHLVGFELAKIEAGLGVAKPKTLTNAPPPPPQVRGQGGRFAVSADTSDFSAFEKAFP